MYLNNLNGKGRTPNPKIIQIKIAGNKQNFPCASRRLINALSSNNIMAPSKVDSTMDFGCHRKIHDEHFDCNRTSN